MKNRLFSFQSNPLKLAIIFHLLLISGLSSQHTLAKDSVYSELLDNCATEIYNQGFDSDKVSLKLKKKIERAGGYRFWINVIDNDSKKSTKTYCAGKKKDGVVSEVKILS